MQPLALLVLFAPAPAPASAPTAPPPAVQRVSEPVKDSKDATDAKEVKPPSFALPANEEARLGAAPTDGEAQKFVPGKGIEFKSKDGRFALAMSLRFGFLYSLRNDPAAAAGDHNFEIRRFRTGFTCSAPRTATSCSWPSRRARWTSATGSSTPRRSTTRTCSSTSCAT